jgi:hypothetical protein
MHVLRKKNPWGIAGLVVRHLPRYRTVANNILTSDGGIYKNLIRDFSRSRSHGSKLQRLALSEKKRATIISCASYAL